MRLEAVSVGRDPPAEVNVVVEVPVGGEPIKYEMDKASGALIVNRFLYTAMRYPGNYGFIPHTLSEDGDPCDVLVTNQRGVIPGAVLAVRPVGVLKMQDEAGGDEKIIAVPVPRLTRRYEKVHNYTDLPEITVRQVQHFFEHYKDLESNKWVKVTGWGDTHEAQEYILRGNRAGPRQGGRSEILTTCSHLYGLSGFIAIPPNMEGERLSSTLSPQRAISRLRATE